MADEQIGGMLQSIATNGNVTNQLLGQIVAALLNQGTWQGTGAITTDSPTAGIGYATGAGGVITQATSKSTGVTLNTITGRITMNNAALGATTSVSFTVTDSAAVATDVILVNHVSGGTLGAYMVQANSQAAGSFNITVRNQTAGSLSEALVLQYAIFRAATA